jgi:tetratricopeptide (TPR) repeat protein
MTRLGKLARGGYDRLRNTLAAPSAEDVMRFGLVLLVLLPAFAFGQQLDDPPVVVEKKLLSREELQQHEKDQLLKQAKTLFGLGVLRERGDRILDALKLYEEASKLDPESVVIRRSLIPIYVVLGRDAEALEACKKVLDIDPDDFEVAFKYAGMLKFNQQRPEAIAALRLALKSKRLTQRIDKQLLIQLELCSHLHQASDFKAEAVALQQFIDLVETRKGELILTAEFREEDLAKYRIEGYEKLARAAMQLKDYNLARKAYQITRQLLIDRGDEGALDAASRINWHLCEIATSQERYPDALKYIDAYLAQGRVSIEPYERKLFLLRKLNRQREVLDTAKKLAEQQPHHVGVQLLLARELSADPNHQGEAEALYNTLARQYTRADIYRGLFKLFQATDRMGRVLGMINENLRIAQEENQSATDRESALDRNRAMMSVLRDDPDMVRSLLGVAANEFRNQPFVKQPNLSTWRLLARLASATGQLDRAEAFYRQCLQVAGQRDDIYFELIRVLHRARKWNELVTLGTELVGRPSRDKSSFDAYVLLYLGIAQGELGRIDEAVRQFDAAYRLPSSDEWKQDIRDYKIRALSNAGKDREAIEECEKMLQELKLPAEQRQVRLTLATAYGLAGKHTESDKQLEMLLETDPNDVLVNNNLGYQWAERNVKLAEAEKLIRRALELDRQLKDGDEDGDKAAYLDSLGWVLFRKGDLQEARKLLEKASSLPDGASDGTVWDHLGDVYFQLKETQKAKQAWENALRIFERDSRAKREGRVEQGKKKLQMVR